MATNPHPESDLTAMESVLYFFTRYFWMITTVFGVPGNVISFVICLLKDNRRFSTCIYMAGLAAVDSLLLITRVGMSTKLFWLNEEPVTEFQFQWAYYITYTSAILSGLFLTLMSIDRLIAVRFPLAAKQRCTPRRATRAIIVSVTIVSVLNLHMFFFFKQQQVNGVGSLLLILEIPGYPALVTFVDMYHLICGSVAPFVIIVVSNLWIIATIRAASSKRKEMGVAEDVAKTQGKETRHLTRMLILVCIAFIVTSIPYRLYTIVLSIPALHRMYDLGNVYWFIRYTMQHYILLDIWHWNYGINFYLYCIGGGRKFRADVQRLFSCCKQ